jgi:beta-phosphoglucomutase-like phosphatase (HAD superfamily)
LALKRIGLPPDLCLVIEDSERGLQAALAACCWVIPSHFTRDSAFGGADQVFSDVTTLADALVS